MAARPAHAGRALPTLCAFGQIGARPSWPRWLLRTGGSRAVGAPVRARTEGIPAEKPGLHNQPRRAVGCAHYLPLRFRVFPVEIQAHGALRPYRSRCQAHSMHAGPMCPQLRMVGRPRRGVRRPISTAGKMPATHSVQPNKHGICDSAPRQLIVSYRKPKNLLSVGVELDPPSRLAFGTCGPAARMGALHSPARKSGKNKIQADRTGPVRAAPARSEMRAT